MSTPIILCLILTGIDSIFALYFAYKEKWLKLAIAVVIGILLNLLIKHLANG